MSEEIVRKHFFFSGMVQGVGFRYRASYIASSLELTGWVRNCYDERVEAEIQGPESRIDSFLTELNRQHFILIENMEVKTLPVQSEHSFEIH